MPRLDYQADWLTRISHLPLVRRAVPARVSRAVLRLLMDRDYTPPLTDRETAAVEESFARVLADAPAGEPHRLAVAHLKAMYTVGVAWQYIQQLDADELVAFLEERLDVEGRDVLERMARHDGPVVMFSPHYGLPVLGCLYTALALRGRTQVHTFFEPPESNLSTIGYREVLERLDVGCIHADGRAAVRALRVLKQGDLLCMQPDVFDNRAGTATLVPSLGGLAYAMTGTAFMALKTDALLVPVYAYQHESAPVRFRFCYREPLPLHHSGDAKRDAYRLTAAIQDEMDGQFQRAPEHWLYWQALGSRMLPGVLPSRDDDDAWSLALDAVGSACSRAAPCVEDFLAWFRRADAADDSAAWSEERRDGSAGPRREHDEPHRLGAS